MPIRLITTADPLLDKLLEHIREAKKHGYLTLAVKCEELAVKIAQTGVLVKQTISPNDLFDEDGTILVPDLMPMEDKE